MDALYGTVLQILYYLNDQGYVLEGKAFSCVARQVTMLLIRDWHNTNPNAKRLNARVEEMLSSDIEYDNKLRNIQRTSKSLRLGNGQIQKAHGIEENDPRNIFRMKSKYDGVPLSDANFQTVLNHVNSSPIYHFMKDVEKKKIYNVKQLSVPDFVNDFLKYENWIEELNCYRTDEEFLARAVDFFCLQVKTHIDLIVQIVTYMDVHGIREFDMERGGAFWAIHCVELEGKKEYMEANQVLFYDRAIPFVFASDQSDYDKAASKWMEYRKAQALAKNVAVQTGVLEQITVQDAVKFIQENYDMFGSRQKTDFGTIGNPKTKRIRIARKIMQEMWA